MTTWETPTQTSAGWGTRNRHIVVAALTVWWTVGLGNLAYALYAHYGLHMRMGWGRWGLVVFAFGLVTGYAYSSKPIYIEGNYYVYDLSRNLFYGAFNGLFWLGIYTVVILPILGIRALLRRRREGASGSDV